MLSYDVIACSDEILLHLRTILENDTRVFYPAKPDRTLSARDGSRGTALQNEIGTPGCRKNHLRIGILEGETRNLYLGRGRDSRHRGT